jgi:hypothetical protein
VLEPGEQYQIAAVTGSENYALNPDGFVVDSRVNYLGNSYYYPSGDGLLRYPNQSTNDDTAWFGPNFRIGVLPEPPQEPEPPVVPIIPAPGALLLLVPGLAGVLRIRKRLLQ